MKGQRPYREQVIEALNQGHTITLKSYLLRERGEEVIRYVLETAMARVDRSEIAAPLHAALRELAQNASKASLKRILFTDLGIDLADDADYERGIAGFRTYLIERKLNRYRERIVHEGLYFTIRFRVRHDALIVKVRNHSSLLGPEERRIREKFKFAAEVDNLYDFYMKYGDATEGAGMGIAMVGILLEEAGSARRNFSIYTDAAGECTIARLIYPFSDAYRTPRIRFEHEMNERNISATDLRSKLNDSRTSDPEWVAQIIDP